MTRTLIVVRDLNLGGIQLMAMRMVRGLGPDVALWALAERRLVLPAELVDDEVASLTALQASAAPSTASVLGQARFLRRGLGRFRPDVVMALGYSTAAVTRLAAPRARVVVGARNSPTETDGSGAKAALKRGWIRWALRGAARVVCISTPLADELLARSWVRDPQTQVVRNGIDAGRVVVSGQRALPASLSLPDRFVVSVGRLSAQKDFSLAISALALAGDPGLHLVVVGEGEERSRLEAHAAGEGVAGRVHLVGALDNPYPVVRRAEAFVLSSKYEGFGTVLVEALALGVPVVSLDCPSGPREILDGGRYGELVTERSPAALAAGIARAVAPPRAVELAALGPARAESFSLEEMLRGYAAVLSSAA